MRKKAILALSLGLTLSACDSGDKLPATPIPSTETEVKAIPVDYTQGRLMNARLGKGINLGNSWDSQGYDDGGWSNPIDDNDFKIIADAGFNSIRLPVRWQYDSDYGTHEVSPERLQGVKEDIQLAINNGLAVIVDFHHYQELFAAGNDYATHPDEYLKEKTHFLAMWQQVATELNVFPDSLLVFDVMNEPTIANADLVNDLTMSAYEVIRAAAPKKTIMFEAFHAAKFADLGTLKLPPDGNIIYSGHYYEPYEYTHQGQSDMYPCIGDKVNGNTINNAKRHFNEYVMMAQKLYPDVNGGHIPMNVGEFGVSGGGADRCGDAGASLQWKALWAKYTIEAADIYDMSWHYWGFVYVGGFDAYDRRSNDWYPGMLEAFGLK